MFAQRINMSLHRAARIITAVFSHFFPIAQMYLLMRNAAYLVLGLICRYVGPEG